MHLYELPLIFALIGLALYTVLAGADFGAGIWQLTAGGGPEAARIRDHAHESMAPVWEANHVWLVFVIVVAWTAYPLALSSIASTLAVPLLIAAVGLILRGTAYALRAASEEDAVAVWIERVFGVSSILTPFALGSGSGSQGVGGSPEDDPNAGDEQRNRQRRADRAEHDRIGRPHDGEHKDQPHVVGLPHRRHRVVSMVTNSGRGRPGPPSAARSRRRARRSRWPR